MIRRSRLSYKTTGDSFMVRVVLAAIAFLLTGQAAVAADDAPYAQTVTFVASRNGKAIGTHSLTFASKDGQRTVTTSIDLAVKIVGITAYRYSHRSREVWDGTRLQSLASQTDDNGKRLALRIARAGDKLEIERGEMAPALQAAILDQGLPRDQAIRESAPGTLLPTSHWNMRQTAQSVLINSQTGLQANVAVANLGRESVQTSARTIEATHYRYSGDMRLDQWFDDKGRWVKAIFTAPDNSTIEYTLQE